MLKHSVFNCCLLLSNFSTVYAMNNVSNFFLGGAPLVSFTAGSAEAKSGQSQFYIPEGACFYGYEPQKSSSKRLLSGGFVGAEWRLPFPFHAIDLGLSYYNASFHVGGLLTQGADQASTDTFSYQNSVQTQQLLVEGKLVFSVKGMVYPYVSVGMGSSFNKTSSYRTSVQPFLAFTPAFADARNHAYSYAIGAGADFRLKNTGWRLGAGYRLSDSGAANLGRGRLDGLPLPFTLNQSHLLTNQVVFQLGYLFS